MTDTNSIALKVGDKVFIFDKNRRVYGKDSSFVPIYREHFREVTISGETSKSWLIGAWKPIKYPKNGSGLYTAEQVEEQCWLKEHRYRVAEIVLSAPYTKVKTIAEIVGYKP